jgi:hypothetical protein
MTAPASRSRRTGLEQLVRQLQNDRKGRNPHVVALEDVEMKMLTAFAKNYPDDAAVHDAGAALLVFGQLCADLVGKLAEVSQRDAGPLFINLARLVGEALYSGRLPVSYCCEYELAGGLPCHYLAEAPDQARLDILLRAHMGLHHPDLPWPPKDEPAQTPYVETGTSTPVAAEHPFPGKPFTGPTLGAAFRRPGARVEVGTDADGALNEISIMRPDRDHA